MDIHQIRRRNLQLLIDEQANGNLSQFVEETIRGSTSYKGLQRVTGPRAARNLGSALARTIEVQLQLQRGWMDQDHAGKADIESLPVVRSERVTRLARSIESLSPPVRELVEKLVKTLAERSHARVLHQPERGRFGAVRGTVSEKAANAAFLAIVACFILIGSALYSAGLTAPFLKLLSLSLGVVGLALRYLHGKRDKK